MKYDLVNVLTLEHSLMALSDHPRMSIYNCTCVCSSQGRLLTFAISDIGFHAENTSGKLSNV